MLKVGSKESKWLAHKQSGKPQPPVLGNKTFFLKAPRKSSLTTDMARNQSWEIRQGPTPHSQDGGLCSRHLFPNPRLAEIPLVKSPQVWRIKLPASKPILGNEFASQASASSPMKWEHLRGFSETVWVKPSGSLINACFFFMASEGLPEIFSIWPCSFRLVMKELVTGVSMAKEQHSPFSNHYLHKKSQPS